MILEQYELSHGIPSGTLKRLGWLVERRKGRPAIRFPTASGPRWRYMDGEQPKYDHPTGYDACWYGLTRAILKGQPYLVDCNGAASTIAADSVSLPAFSYQSGEGSKPSDTALAELNTLWQGKIYVVFDCDAAGRTGAQKRAVFYRSQGFDVEILDLGLEKAGADLADFVMLHGANTPERLLACARLPIPVEKPLLPRPKTRSTEDTPVRELVSRALKVLADHRRNDYNAWLEILTAVHAGLGDNGLDLAEDWSVGGDHYKPGAVAAKFRSFKKAGITVEKLYQRANEDFGRTWRPARQRSIRLTPALTVEVLEDAPDPSTYLWRVGLPTTVRAALNRYAAPAIAPLLELWNEAINAGYTGIADPVDVKFLCCVAEQLGRQVNRATLLTGLKAGVGQFLSFHAYIDNTITKEEDTNTGSIISDQKCKNSLGAGRKANLYTLLPKVEMIASLARMAAVSILQEAFPADSDLIAPVRAEFLATLGAAEPVEAARQLDARYATIIEAQPGYAEALSRARRKYEELETRLLSTQTLEFPAGRTYKNAVDYQALCAWVIVDAHGGATQYSRTRLCDMIGCPDRKLPIVFRRAGITVLKRQFVEQPITSMEQFRKIPNAYNYDVLGFPVRITTSRSKFVMPFGSAERFTFVSRELDAGATVTLVYRQSNKQVFAAPESTPVAPEVVTVEKSESSVRVPKIEQAELWAPPAGPRYRQQQRILAGLSCLCADRQLWLVVFVVAFVQNLQTVPAQAPLRKDRGVPWEWSWWHKIQDNLPKTCTMEVAATVDKGRTVADERDPLIEFITGDLHGVVTAIELTQGPPHATDNPGDPVPDPPEPTLQALGRTDRTRPGSYRLQGRGRLAGARAAVYPP